MATTQQIEDLSVLFSALQTAYDVERKRKEYYSKSFFSRLFSPRPDYVHDDFTVFEHGFNKFREAFIKSFPELNRSYPTGMSMEGCKVSFAPVFEYVDDRPVVGLLLKTEDIDRHSSHNEFFEWSAGHGFVHSYMHSDDPQVNENNRNYSFLMQTSGRVSSSLWDPVWRSVDMALGQMKGIGQKVSPVRSRVSAALKRFSALSMDKNRSVNATDPRIACVCQQPVESMEQFIECVNRRASLLEDVCQGRIEYNEANRHAMEENDRRLDSYIHGIGNEDTVLGRELSVALSRVDGRCSLAALDMYVRSVYSDGQERSRVFVRRASQLGYKFSDIEEYFNIIGIKYSHISVIGECESVRQSLAKETDERFRAVRRRNEVVSYDQFKDNIVQKAVSVNESVIRFQRSQMIESVRLARESDCYRQCSDERSRYACLLGAAVNCGISCAMDVPSVCRMLVTVDPVFQNSLSEDMVKDIFLRHGLEDIKAMYDSNDGVRKLRTLEKEADSGLRSLLYMIADSALNDSLAVDALKAYGYPCASTGDICDAFRQSYVYHHDADLAQDLYLFHRDAEPSDRYGSVIFRPLVIDLSNRPLLGCSSGLSQSQRKLKM